ncbi:hypothetical protein [Streptomyces sp. WM6378]|uniref:hypothetical protein n=1 Tax=Streptomyces sp. WM6378 TaxID=1415557 RepID=UPI0006B02BA9|nr:hypothetical protein [Streptomyces sp. WM6378]KOU33551.1 hypothetical protein ADK54_42015 [Streptomyces sp. WM6378]
MPGLRTDPRSHPPPLRQESHPGNHADGLHNQLAIEANCPIAGTAEFKASAVRVEKPTVAAVRS